MKKLSLLSLLIIGTSPLFAANTGSPESVKIKFAEFWASPNADCSNLVQVFSESSPSYQDVVSGPTFGQVNVPNGTYQCVAWKMSDLIMLTPDFDSDSGNCHDGVEITRDLFRAGAGNTVSPTGTIITGSGTLGSPVEDWMWVYMSTTGNDTTNSGMSVAEPGALSSPFVVAGNRAAEAVFDFTNGIDDTGGSCSPERVDFSFR